LLFVVTHSHCGGALSDTGICRLTASVSVITVSVIPYILMWVSELTAEPPPPPRASPVCIFLYI